MSNAVVSIIIVLLLVSCTKITVTEGRGSSPVARDYEMNCSYCHGLDGMGFDVQKTPVMGAKYAMLSSEPRCKHCHGTEEFTLGTPRLAGQRVGYVENSLRAFRSGDRVNPHMNEVAKNLSDERIKELAKYVSAMGGRP